MSYSFFHRNLSPKSCCLCCRWLLAWELTSQMVCELCLLFLFLISEFKCSYLFSFFLPLFDSLIFIFCCLTWLIHNWSICIFLVRFVIHHSLSKSMETYYQVKLLNLILPYKRTVGKVYFTYFRKVGELDEMAFPQNVCYILGQEMSLDR